MRTPMSNSMVRKAAGRDVARALFTPRTRRVRAPDGVPPSARLVERRSSGRRHDERSQGSRRRASMTRAHSSQRDLRHYTLTGHNQQIGLLSQYAPALPIAHQAQWLDALLNRSIPRYGDTAAWPQAEAGLRTLVALDRKQLCDAEALVRRRYALQGYAMPVTQNLGEGIIEAAGLTLVAINDGALRGTLTLRADSPTGLAAEKTYGGEIENLRRQGRRVGEIVRLAVEDDGADGRAVLQTLIESVYLLARVVHPLTDVVIEVNPRHVRFYRRVLGFVIMAPERLCTRAGAPSVLMRIDVNAFGRRLHSGAGARAGDFNWQALRDGSKNSLSAGRTSLRHH